MVSGDMFSWLEEMSGKPSTRRKTLVLLHYAPHEEDARLVVETFQADDVSAVLDTALTAFRQVQLPVGFCGLCMDSCRDCVPD